MFATERLPGLPWLPDIEYLNTLVVACPRDMTK
jgi:hypothetical protein